jgi:hypothetical protein
LDDVSKKLADQKTTSSYLQKDFFQTRFQHLIFGVSEEIARISVGANLSRKQAEAALNSLVIKAQMEAASKGARAQGDFKVADIISRPDGTTAAKLKSLILDKMVGNPEPLALIAVASLNFYKDEPVALDVWVKPNPLVYHRGQVMEQVDVDGSASDPEILRMFTAFGTSLSEKALRDQMIPRNNGESFGSVSPDQVLNLVNEVKHAGHMVHLQAVVPEDTHAADPLKLDFRIQ